MRQPGIPLVVLDGLDSPRQRVRVGHDDGALLAAGYTRVEEIPVEHMPVRLVYNDDRHLRFTALELVDGGGAGRHNVAEGVGSDVFQTAVEGDPERGEIGRASCRERVCQYV